MKKRTILYCLVGLCCYFIISSYSAGPGTNGYDCTGAETALGNPTGCTTCHGSTATAGIAVSLTLDSAGGVTTTHYKGGMTYTVTIKGTNNTTSTLPKFGLQIGSILGTSAVATPTNAGTWSTTCPVGTHYAAPSAGNMVVGVVEHNTKLPPTTGTGGNGSTYVESFVWTAPASGTGAISFWGVLNAINNNGSADAGDLWNLNHVTINEWTSSGNAVNEISPNQFNVSVFPNPASDYINLTYKLDSKSVVSIKLINLNGQAVAELLNENQSSGAQSNTIKLPEGLDKGVYFLQATINDQQIVRKILVQ
jgi:hypothetical protein